MRRSERKQAEPDLGILASWLLLSVQQELGETMEQEGFAPLGPRYGAVLAYLDEEGTRATELAQLSGQHKQVVGTLIDELVAMDCVERQPDPQDRRAKLIVPTAHGLERMRRSDAIMAAIEERHARLIGKSAYAEFKQAFKRIAEAQRDRR
ncbi:MarR family winged helix-turn-helix transcriptional regulator [Catelliglobosispora koreensis]|uniref:MarR family winged helix-turn-helix transcriptional regulator n=1 Tax=Catelliglobosispora koreensis TaxID=129052 RepID=UPI000382AE9B|nr:MarR family winged helix-turn-helix transcriptional regulator [Catelliglobosispora koreensis]